MNQLLECIPNFSEGRNPDTIDAIADAIRAVAGAYLLHIDISPAANRTVITFAGAPEAVTEAAFRAITTAAELIDMSHQEGVHPRIGATDVCPLVPLQGISMDEAVQYARQLGARVGDSLQIPVFLYEYAASAAHRRALPAIRKGQYEGLAQRMTQPGWQPDYGPAALNAKSGATVIGARDILVAFNISLNTEDVSLAEQLARQLRESGYTETTNGNKHKVPGLLPKVRAIGWHMADYNQAQVSFNLLDYRITSPLQVWEACKQLATAAGATLAGSEVIGLIPEACLLEAGRAATSQQTGLSREQLVQAAIAYMGLDRLKAFDPQEKILEYRIAAVCGPDTLINPA